MRQRADHIKSITTYGARRIELTETQYFCTTKKAIELWDTKGFPAPGICIVRWSKSKIWAINNEVL